MGTPSPFRRSWRVVLFVFLSLIVGISGITAARRRAAPPAPELKPAAPPAPSPAPKPAPAKPAAQPATPMPPPSPAPQQLKTDAQASLQNLRSSAPLSQANLLRDREKWFHDQRAYPLVQIPAGVLQQAIQQRDRMVGAQSIGPNLAAPLIGFPGDGLWHLAGPQPTNVPFGNTSFGANSGYPTASGRVTAIAVDTTDATGQTIFLGTAAGGVWRTVTGGSTWIPLTDTQPSLAVGSIAIDPTNHNNIYVGTGEENFNGDAYFGAGVLKSADGGTTWTQQGKGTFAGPITGALGGARIGAIAVDPNNNQVILAGVAFGDQGSPSGIYRSADGGATWTLVQGGDAGTAVVFDPVASTKTAYAALGYSNGDANNGIYKSTDEGATWSKLTVSTLLGTQMGRITLAFAPSTTGGTAKIYAAIGDASNGSNLLLGLYVTVNAGSTWAKLPNTPDFCVEPGGLDGQCYYDLAVAVHPTNPNFVVVGGAAYTDNSTTLFKSTDGGTTWSTDSTTPSTDFTIGSSNVRPHVDTHALSFAPNGATPPALHGRRRRGVAYGRSARREIPLWVDLNTSLAISQFYPGTQPSISDENWGFGGTQDNDIQVFEGTLDWTQALACGDGGYTAVDSSTPTTIYAGCNADASAKVMKSVFYGLSTPGPVPAPCRHSNRRRPRSRHQGTGCSLFHRW